MSLSVTESISTLSAQEDELVLQIVDETVSILSVAEQGPQGPAGANSSPAGSNTQIQFNNSGTFGASPYLTWNGLNNTLQIGGNSITALLRLYDSDSDDYGLLQYQDSGYYFYGPSSSPSNIYSRTISTYEKSNITGGFLAFSNLATDCPVDIFGTSGQSANLTNWRSSASTILASISSNGAFTSAGNISGVQFYSSGGVFTGAIRNTGGQNLSISSAGYSTININPTSTSPTITTASGNQSAFAILPIYNQTTSTAANTDLLINRTETSIGSGEQNLINLQVAGTSRVRVSNLGAFFLNDVDSGQSDGANGIRIIATTAGRGAGVQIGNAVTGASNPWQFFAKGNQDNFVIGRAGLRDNIILSGTQGSVFFPGQNGGASFAAGNYTLMASAGTSASFVPIIARGAASQTANLQEWQNSAGTAVANVTAAGVFNTTSATTLLSNNTTTSIITRSSNQLQYGNHSFWQSLAFYTNGNLRMQLDTAVAGALINAPAAGVVGAIIRGAASQTANLLEIQNSAASNVASFDASGNLTLVGTGATQLICGGIRRRAGNTNFLLGSGGSTATGSFTSITLSPLMDGVWTQTSGTLVAVSITPSYNQASGTASNTDFLIDRTETAVGSGTQNLIDLRVGGVSRHRVDNLGRLFIRQATTAGAPPYALGAMYFDTTLNKLRIGGASAWETVTSI
jgi:hypothetical protein